MPTTADIKKTVEELRAPDAFTDEATKQLHKTAANLLESLHEELVRRGQLLQSNYSDMIVLRHENNRFRRILNIKTLPLLRNMSVTDVDRVVELHNEARKKNIWFSARSVLVKDSVLCGYAQQHAAWMATATKLKHSNMKHIMDLGFSPVAENIAVGASTAEAVMKMWMWSIGHRSNILNRVYDRIGVGAAKAANGAIYWCVCFGKGKE